MRRGNFYGCGKEGHKFKDFPNVRGQEKGNGRAQSSGPILKPPKRNRFSTLRSRGEQEESPDVVTVWYKSSL